MTETARLPVTDTADESVPPASPFRWRVANRPDTRFGHAAGGVAGILLVAAVFAFVIEVTDDDPTFPGVGFNALLIVIALAAGFWVRGPVRSAGVTAVVLAVPLLWLFAVIGDGSNVGRGDFRLILLLTVASYVALYLLIWTRGRAIFLGGALLFAANWIIFEIASQDAPLGIGAVTGVQSEGFRGPSSLVGGDNLREVAVTSIVIAIILLAVGCALDRRRAAGGATPLLVVGSLYAVIGALTLGADVEDVYAAGIFVAIAGLAIGLAGSLGRRRGTSWLGAIVLLLGALTVVAQGTEDSVSGDGGEGIFGGFALIAAAVLLLIGVFTARVAHEPIDGGEPIPVKEPKPDPEPEPALVGATPAAGAAPVIEEPATPAAAPPVAPAAAPAPEVPPAPAPEAPPAPAPEAPPAPAPAAPPPVDDEE